MVVSRLEDLGDYWGPTILHNKPGVLFTIYPGDEPMVYLNSDLRNPDSELYKDVERVFGHLRSDQLTLEEQVAFWVCQYLSYGHLDTDSLSVSESVYEGTVDDLQSWAGQCVLCHSEDDICRWLAGFDKRQESRECGDQSVMS